MARKYKNKKRKTRCKICGKLVYRQGLGPHMKMHKKKTATAKPAVPDDWVLVEGNIGSGSPRIVDSSVHLLCYCPSCGLDLRTVGEAMTKERLK